MTQMTTNAQRIGLALTAFTAAWSATGFEDTPQAIIGSLIAAIAGFLKPHEAKIPSNVYRTRSNYWRVIVAIRHYGCFSTHCEQANKDRAASAAGGRYVPHRPKP
jgi:hypothetical protein